MSAFAKAITNNLRLRTSRSPSSASESDHGDKESSPPRFKNRGGYTVADIKQRLFNQGLKIDVDSKKTKRTRYKDYFQKKMAAREKSINSCSAGCVSCKALGDEKRKVRPPPAMALWQRDTFLARFLVYLRSRDVPQAASVSRHWQTAVSRARLWSQLAFVVDLRSDTSSNRLVEQRDSFLRRGYSLLILRHIGDLHVPPLIEAFAPAESHVLQLRVELSTLTDRGLERLTDTFASAHSLHLVGCNDVSEVALWSCLSPRLQRLSILDCVHVADDTLGAVSQLLPNLRELSLQAYHISDLSLSYFNSKQGATVEKVVLNHCMEVTNRGLLNLVQALPNLRHLSLAGCSKISDDGVDLLCENLKLLKTLDLSWCNKITDGGLECIACDLQALEELHLDRCSLVTDLGIGYLTNLPQLRQLSLRFCHGISDLSLAHLRKLPHLNWLSIAGCKQLSAEGLMKDGVPFQNLRRLEVTNCPGLTLENKTKLSQILPSCVILD